MYVRCHGQEVQNTWCCCVCLQGDVQQVSFCWVHPSRAHPPGAHPARGAQWNEKIFVKMSLHLAPRCTSEVVPHSMAKWNGTPSGMRHSWLAPAQPAHAHWLRRLRTWVCARCAVVQARRMQAAQCEQSPWHGCRSGPRSESWHEKEGGMMPPYTVCMAVLYSFDRGSNGWQCHAQCSICMPKRLSVVEQAIKPAVHRNAPCLGATSQPG